MTSLADSSRVTVVEDDAEMSCDATALGVEADAEAGAAVSGIALLNTSRTNARTRSLVASSAMMFDKL
jgi:hypothetical protein